MMLQMTITDAGLDALVDAQDGVTDPIVITELGITQTVFVAAPTLTALPGEVKRIGTLSGTSVAENVIHLTAQDSTTDIYSLRGFALYLEDGTLFAAYSQATPILIKVDIAAFLVSFDVAFADAVDTAIEFGDATFLFPPATETVKGAIELATEAEVNAGADTTRAVTPATLSARLALIVGGDIAAETAARIAGDSAIAARTITGGGLITGGGNLGASRVLTVTAASQAETAAGALADKAVTPFGLTPIITNITNNAAAIVTEAGSRVAAVAAIEARTITGSGLVTGGGNLGASRVLNVAAASAAEIVTGTEAGKAITPQALAQVDNGYAGNISIRGLGGSIIKIGIVSVSIPAGASVTFPVAFPTACDAVLVNPLGNMNSGDERDEAWWVGSMSASGFTIGTDDDGNTVNFRWVAFGH